MDETPRFGLPGHTVIRCFDGTDLDGALECGDCYQKARYLMQGPEPRHIYLWCGECGIGG